MADHKSNALQVEPSSHTPGKWIRDDDEIGIEITIGGDLVFLNICTLGEPSLYRTTDAIIQKEANANLILAAPELLSALKQLNIIIQAGGDFQLGPKGRHSTLPASLDKLIAKAEGRHV